MALPPPHMKAKKRFGQNFLIDDYIIASIVDAINPKPGQRLIEIGPGHAAITRPVLDRAHALTAIELDRDLCALLREDPFLKGLEIIEADALKVNFSQLAKDGPIRVFGNLPYNITSPIIFHLLEQNGIEDMHFMLQREVVERLCSGPDSKDYGRLTVMAQFYAAIMPVLEVPPEAFSPRPKVVSAVVRLKPYNLDDKTRALAPFLNTVVTKAFSARRKTLRNALSGLFDEHELNALNIDGTKRAENLSVKTYVELAKYLLNKDEQKAF